MSEYQCYEFQALDRPLDQREMARLRAVSTRAVITTSRFVNHYEWCNLNADPSAWVARCFDTFLYLANWSTHNIAPRFLPVRAEPRKRYAIATPGSGTLLSAYKKLLSCNRGHEEGFLAESEPALCEAARVVAVGA